MILMQCDKCYRLFTYDEYQRIMNCPTCNGSIFVKVNKVYKKRNPMLSLLKKFALSLNEAGNFF